MASNIQCSASWTQSFYLLESRDVKTSLRPTVVHLETPFCVSESYIFIFALGDEG